eukprot:403332813
MEHLKTVGIVREIKNKWERRCALTPQEVKILVDDGIRVFIQSSPNRCYQDEEFLEAGAEIQEDLSSCDVIFGVKEVPIEDLIPNKTYFFFSHTIKAQEYNMPLLDAMLEKKIRQIDYECIRENKEVNPQRLVAFGRYAGIAGAFDFFRGVGEFLLQKKIQTPFIFLGSAYMYEDYEAMSDALKRVAKNIAKVGTPKQYSPMVFAVTGTGRVAQGIIEVLEQLPHVFVDPDELKDVANNYDNKKIIISQFTGKHLVKHKEGNEFSKSDYYAHPNNYESKFIDYLPFVHFIINGIYWEAKYPRILSIEELREAVLEKRSALLGVCDISADYMGSIEFTTQFTSIENPFLLYEPIKEEFFEKMQDATDNTILFHSVDHLPAEMPKEASNHFGEKLLPFVKQVVNSDPNLPFEEQNDLPPEIRNAVICAHGKLTPAYEYIEELRKIRQQAKKHQEDYMNKVKEAERKTSSLRRGMRFATVVFQGHLFDTKFFNKLIDILEENKIDFRVVEWEVGNQSAKSSQVTLQLFAQDTESMDRSKETIEKLAAIHKIEIFEGTGPAFENQITKDIHQDRVL